MPFIRLSDNYIDNPKFLALSEGSFCLWHEAMAFARKHQTDGIIPFTALKTFRFHTKGREKQLATPHCEGANALWVLIPKTGYRIHDYLEWNLSREEEQSERSAANARMRRFRSRHGDAVTNAVTSAVTNAFVPDMDMDRKKESKDRGSGGKPRGMTYLEPPAPVEIEARAGQLLEKYAELFYKHQRGARYHRRDHLDFPKACQLCETWADDARLEKLATLVLTTDDGWIAGTDRGFAVFAAKASWADARLTAWELEHGLVEPA